MINSDYRYTQDAPQRDRSAILQVYSVYSVYRSPSVASKTLGRRVRVVRPGYVYAVEVDVQNKHQP